MSTKVDTKVEAKVNNKVETKVDTEVETKVDTYVYVYDCTCHIREMQKLQICCDSWETQYKAATVNRWRIDITRELWFVGGAI